MQLHTRNHEPKEEASQAPAELSGSGLLLPDHRIRLVHERPDLEVVAVTEALSKVFRAHCLVQMWVLAEEVVVSMDHSASDYARQALQSAPGVR